MCRSEKRSLVVGVPAAVLTFFCAAHHLVDAGVVVAVSSAGGVLPRTQQAVANHSELNEELIYYQAL